MESMPEHYGGRKIGGFGLYRYFANYEDYSKFLFRLIEELPTGLSASVLGHPLIEWLWEEAFFAGTNGFATPHQLIARKLNMRARPVQR